MRVDNPNYNLTVEQFDPKFRAYFTVVKLTKPQLKTTWCDAFKRFNFVTVKFCDALFHSVTVFGQKFLIDYFEFKNNYDLQN